MQQKPVDIEYVVVLVMKCNIVSRFIFLNDQSELAKFTLNLTKGYKQE